MRKVYSKGKLMPIFFPDHTYPDHWNAAYRWLIEKPGREKVFSRVFSRVSGFIIAWWQEANSESPTHFLKAEFPGVGMMLNGDWVRFGDDTQPENPKQYKFLKANLKIIQQLRVKMNDEKIGLVLWWHPDSEVLAMPDYRLMENARQLPGCPRQ